MSSVNMRPIFEEMNAAELDIINPQSIEELLIRIGYFTHTMSIIMVPEAFIDGSILFILHLSKSVLHSHLAARW